MTLFKQFSVKWLWTGLVFDWKPSSLYINPGLPASAGYASALGIPKSVFVPAFQWKTAFAGKGRSSYVCLEAIIQNLVMLDVCNKLAEVCFPSTAFLPRHKGGFGQTLFYGTCPKGAF